METENGRLPPTQPVAGRTQDSAAYYERHSQRVFEKLLGKNAEIVGPIMITLGEQLEGIFQAKGHAPDSPSQRCVDRAMGFVFSLTWDAEAGGTDERILNVFGNFLNHPILSKHSWRELWSDWIFLADTPVGIVVQQLLSYAFDGLWLRYYEEFFDEAVNPEDYAIRLIEGAKSAVVTLGIDNPATRSLNTLLLAAEARLALDQGRNVTPEQLASLARIGIKSMRNALAPSSGSGLKMRDGVIVAESALIWLHARGNYKTTVWREEESLIAPIADPIAGEILFVPFASDDIEFHPVKCRRDRKYTVGPKGAEQTFIDYRAALDCLARMQPASYWKHPNSANNWGTVTAIGFRPRTPAELGLEPAEGGEK